MAKTGKLLRRATKTAMTTVKKAAKAVEQKVEREVRRRRVRRVLRDAAGVAVTTGAGVLAAAAIEESVQAVRRRRKAARNAAFEAVVPVAPELAIDKVTEALKAEGFGVLTRIDTHQVFQQKLGVSFRPFTILGALKVDIRMPYFGTAAGLAAHDFHAAASKNYIGAIPNTPSSNWYTKIWTVDTFFSFVNLAGTTQFRLRFKADDNNDNGADYMRFYSGDAGASVRPTLIIEYYVP